MAILSTTNLKKIYGNGENAVHALDGVTLSIEPGEFTAIIGTSGSGKSTLLHMLGGLDRPTSGSVTVDGKDIFSLKDEALTIFRRRKIGFVFQTYNLIGRTSALKNVELPMLYAGLGKRERSERGKELLEMVGMESRFDHNPDELSGGQKQRVAIAGVVAMRPQCIILDEPTAMLDPVGRKEVIETVRELNEKENVTVILITHYMEEVIGADRVFVMDQGEVVLQGTPKEVFSQVEFLKKYRLDVPQVTELAYELKMAGVELEDGILTTKELVEGLKRYLLREKGKDREGK